MTSKSALQTWQDRLEFLNRERAIAASADIKFQLDAQIVECEQKIRELSEKIVNDSSTESSSASERENPVQTKKNMAVNPPVDFVVITALEEERKAFLKQLPQSRKLPPTDGDIRVYHHAELPVEIDGTQGNYDLIILSLLNMGRVEATTATSDAIRRWEPRFVLLVGIAGGIASADIGLGDILIADKFVDYELQKIREEGKSVRYQVHLAAPRLLGAAQNFDIEDCLKLLSTQPPIEKEPRRFVGAIASGDKVIAFDEVIQEYQKDWPKLIGVEMEAAGVATASFQAANAPGFFMVRGVSDLADQKKDSAEVKAWRNYACDIAVVYTIALLQSGPVPFGKKKIEKDFNQDIQQKWESLRDTLIHPALCKSLRDIESQISTLQLPLEFHDKLINIFQNNKDDLNNSIPDNLLKEIDNWKSTFKQKEWTVEQVNQASKIIQVYIIDNVLKIFPEQKGKLLHVPIVLVVMNREDAGQLASGKACKFKSKELSEHYKQIIDAIFSDSENSADRWINCYADSPQDWRPFSNNNNSKTIKEIVTEAIKVVEKKDYHGQLTPDFFDIHTLIENREKLKELRQNGCIVIVDPISMRHPKIQSFLQLSSIDVSHNTALIMMAMDNWMELVKTMSVVIELNISETEASKRRDDDDNHRDYIYECIEWNESQAWVNKFKTSFNGGIINLYPPKQINKTFWKSDNSENK
jgi:nucleoside phosphorylase